MSMGCGCGTSGCKCPKSGCKCANLKVGYMTAPTMPTMSAAMQAAMAMIVQSQMMTAAAPTQLTDADAMATLAIWKAYLPDSILLPGIGLPSQDNGVLTLTHTFGTGNLLSIDGLKSKSPLSNNALYSSEIAGGQYLNLYEILIPDIPGQPGERSTAQIYIDSLEAAGLNVSACHFHWTGATAYAVDHGVIAVHHYNVGMTPQEFSMVMTGVLTSIAAVIASRVALM